MTTTWKEKATAARKAGYTPKGNWERTLRKHLNLCFPALVKELGPELDDYLQATVWEAMEAEERLLDKGTDPQVARELVMADLLQVPADEQDKVEPWEREGAEATATEAAEEFLTRAP